ncbi:acyl-CoA thioesterase II [Williamsia sp. CHRR-6]|uniref:acyl-CoA thioesterase n=1 Tax=Williamsia sp. CHRR-6 TaxID=2835871 RepID=UPI001BDA70C4|nr:acyl-CoA thioesterase domain-containing protein [Williamsia sp. CHRR-6]MBT0567574.1 thioesterase family protein [Williamsia sp. CHRR-6]
MSSTAVTKHPNDFRSDGFLSSIQLTDLGDDRFTARHQVIPSGRAYGGETVAQAIAATMRSVEPDRRIHSFHGYFLRAADVNAESSYAVQRLRDGRNFSARAVQGEQVGKTTFTGLASFQSQPAHGVAHADPMPAGLPDPESLPTSEDRVAGAQVRDGNYWSRQRNFDMRHVHDPVYTTHATQREPRQVVWVKAFQPLPEDPLVHQLALAYVCDYTLLEPVLRHHDAAWSDPGVVTASLDHAMWWHHPGRADEWIALVQDSPEAGHGLAMTRASLYAQDGTLLATTVQQGLLSLGQSG